MKWMLATILSVVMVAPAFASVDFTLTAEDGSTLITLPAGTTTANIVLNLGLTKPNPAVGLTAYNAALQLATVQGAGQFKITGRTVGAAMNDAKLVSVASDPDTGDDIDLAVGSVLGPKSVDVGIYKASGFWGATKFPAVTNTFAIELTGLADGDTYDVTIGDPGAGIVVADNASPKPNKVEIGALGTVRVVVTPEPASLLLLAVGGLFLRRRHA